MGYFENVQWTLCVKESICVRPLIGMIRVKFRVGSTFSARFGDLKVNGGGGQNDRGMLEMARHSNNNNRGTGTIGEGCLER